MVCLAISRCIIVTYINTRVYRIKWTMVLLCGKSVKVMRSISFVIFICELFAKVKRIKKHIYTATGNEFFCCIYLYNNRLKHGIFTQYEAYKEFVKSVCAATKCILLIIYTHIHTLT